MKPKEVGESLFASATCPTQKQYELLRMMGGGSAWMSARKREAEPLLRRGWITADYDGAYYHFARITALGLASLALAVERYGLPEFKGGVVYERVCAECETDWRPRCKCGSRSYRDRPREVQRG